MCATFGGIRETRAKHEACVKYMFQKKYIQNPTFPRRPQTVLYRNNSQLQKEKQTIPKRLFSSQKGSHFL